MSGQTQRYDAAQLQELLASGYVASALQGPARRRFETLMLTRPALRQRVEAWENRLTALADATPEVQPPVRIWRTVQQRIAPASATPAASGGFWNSLAFWRPFGALAACLVVVVIAYAGYQDTRPTPVLQVTEGPPVEGQPNYVAVLDDESGQPVLVVTAFKGPWRINVEPLRELPATQGKVFQVWAIERETGTTRPLLQISKAEALQAPLSEDSWKAIKSSESLMVTLENASAVLTAPSGPALFSGPCLNLKGPTPI